MASSKSPVILVDFSNLFFRCHYAFHNLSCEGKPTGLTYGVLKTIHELRENVSRRIVFCWDHGIPVIGAPRPKNWRDELMPTYKANRTHDKTETNRAFCQLPELHEAICQLGYGHVSVMGLEADDIIGILSNDIRDDILIFSTDQDFYQLLGYQDMGAKKIEVLVPKKEKKGFRRIGKTEVEAAHGFGIERWAEYLALGGDSCDNIKPMRGMGPKTAAKLICSGVDLQRKLDKQPQEFIKKYGAVWESIIQSYEAARLPRSWKDSRIAKCVNGPLFVPTDQKWTDKTTSQKHFIKFCADRDMVTLLSLRRQLFETGESTCPDKNEDKNESTRNAVVRPLSASKRYEPKPRRATLI